MRLSFITNHCDVFVGVEKSTYVVNDYIKNIGKETEESNSTLLLSRLVKIRFLRIVSS